MTDLQMIFAYVEEIQAAGGEVPEVRDDPIPMQIAKLDDTWRRWL